MSQAYHRAETCSTFGLPPGTDADSAVLPVFPGSVGTDCPKSGCRHCTHESLGYSINISNALTLGLPEDLALKSNESNVALALFYVSYVIFEIPSNLLLKRLQPHIWREWQVLIRTAILLWLGLTAVLCILVSGCTFAFGLVNLCHGFRTYMPLRNRSPCTIS